MPLQGNGPDGRGSYCIDQAGLQTSPYVGDRKRDRFDAKSLDCFKDGFIVIRHPDFLPAHFLYSSNRHGGHHIGKAAFSDAKGYKSAFFKPVDNTLVQMFANVIDLLEGFEFQRQAVDLVVLIKTRQAAADNGAAMKLADANFAQDRFVITHDAARIIFNPHPVIGFAGDLCGTFLHFLHPDRPFRR